MDTPLIDKLDWAPPEWACCGFPLAAPGSESVWLATAVETLLRLADSVTPADSTALGPAMHTAHMLVSRQGPDGMWPAAINARTGEFIGCGRSDAPVRLYERLAAALETTEFEHVLAFARSSRALSGGGLHAAKH